jgi:hypothetical protein
MDFPNTNWCPIDGGVKYVADCSSLGVSPGVHPANSYEARDPWNREMTHNSVVWTSHRNREQETTHWTVTVRDPEGKPVVLQVFND